MEAKISETFYELVMQFMDHLMKSNHTLLMENKNKHNHSTEDYIVEDNKKTRFGGTFIAIILIILLAAVAITGVFFDLW
ncbi:hypothetical protein [Zunongwangia sp. H14]|uniref:hypothetical protein n=1 Tax=Zunongwangia sp. H14 TaxID=3240792 RepID=UPI0035682546